MPFFQGQHCQGHFSVELTAYHEAGHAFLATYLGAKVRSVTIEPDDDDGPQRFGDTQVVWRRSRLSEQKFCEYAIKVSLAGPVAEMLYSGDPYHPGLVAEWANDWQAAWDLAETLFPDHIQRLSYLESITSELYRLMDSEPNWSAVAALADSLLAHETLEHEDVEEIVGEWLE
jgi:ATP-dependent Zn protease